jgi:hypothetical protein
VTEQQSDPVVVYQFTYNNLGGFTQIELNDGTQLFIEDTTGNITIVSQHGNEYTDTTQETLGKQHKRYPEGQRIVLTRDRKDPET